MNRDKAHVFTDREIKSMERRIKNSYAVAYREIQDELSKVVSKLNLTPEMPSSQRLVLMNKRDRLNILSEQMADTLKRANNEAIKYLKDTSVSVYQANYNFEAEKFKFALLDKTAVKNVLNNKVNPFTELSIEAERDRGVIIRQLKGDLTTSLLKGESIPDMARRIKGTVEKSMKDSIRIARTETTRVQNSARYDVGKHGEELGFEMMKEWVATSDDRTRDEHNEADGQQVPIDEPFNVGGEEMMYPGDISLGASAWNVINCRCTIVNIIKQK